MSAIPARTRDSLYERAGFACERCGRTDGHFSAHHRSGRRAGGSKDPRKHALSNLVLICGDGVQLCHGHVESRRQEAISEGWIVPSWNDPAAIPIRLRFGWFHLTDDGTYSPCDRECVLCEVAS